MKKINIRTHIRYGHGKGDVWECPTCGSQHKTKKTIFTKAILNCEVCGEDLEVVNPRINVREV